MTPALLRKGRPAAVAFLFFCTFLLTGCQLSDMAGRGITRRIASNAARFALGISKAPTQPALTAVPVVHTACTVHIQDRRALSAVTPATTLATVKTGRAVPAASVVTRTTTAPRVKTERVWVIDFGRDAVDAAELASLPSEVDPAEMTAVASKHRTVRVSTVTRTNLHLHQSEKQLFRAPCREANRLPDPSLTPSSS